jgi:CRP/FNR family transcriptional regulator
LKKYEGGAIITIMMTDKIASLSRTALFGELTEAGLRALAQRAIERRLARDEILFITGEQARGLFVIVSGALRAVRDGVDGREQVIHVERAGATIAEIPVFDDKPYPSTVIAEEETVVLFLEKREVRNLCLEHPQIALSALKLMAGRLRKCAELVETLSLKDVDQRVARWLLNEAIRCGTRSPQGLEIRLRLTHQQIASRIGSVREVVSRALARLQQNDLIRIEGRLITITDEEALSAYAES